MGDFKVRQIRNKSDRHRMYRRALDDIRTFEKMWEDNLFIQEPIKIGAEQELCLVDKYYQPSKSALKFLDTINDIHYTNELGLYNLEINLDPEILTNNCFSTIESKLLSLLNKGQERAFEINEKMVMTGILPTISLKHLQFDYMTPIPRYKTLSQILYNIRGGDFEIYLQGVDDLMASLGSALFEACNTSFQLHLQIKPEEFVDKYNWAQMISGPVLAPCVNSPLVFGRELWAESRIAIFKQSLDTRNSKNHLRKKMPRVYFGDGWLRDSPVNLWKNELMRFPLIITSNDLPDSGQQLSRGETPELRAIRLHNGTTYTWNRLCYGPGSKAHLRIECRYIPSGPSAIDEVANFAFWTGLMNAVPDEWSEQIKSISFKAAKGNFINAARTGLNTVFDWFGKNISAKALLLDTLIPMSKQGLEKCNITAVDIDKYLSVIEERIVSEQTGSEWITKSFRKNTGKTKAAIQKQAIVARIIEYQKGNVPVSQWELLNQDQAIAAVQKVQREYSVSQLMSTDVFSISEDTSLDLVRDMILWKNIHHLPVENNNGDLVGIITDGLLKKKDANADIAKYASDIMITKVISVQSDISIEGLRKILQEHRLSGVPVTFENKVIGIITLNDLIVGDLE